MQMTALTSAFAYEAYVDALLAQMTLAEKIGQMTQVEKNSISPEEVTRYTIGSVLSGGGGNPEGNSPHTWAAMVRAYLEAGQNTRLAIPVIYGVDAVHGHNNLQGAVIFPHNIGLGAAGDPELVERIAEVVARELLATHVRWTFAPAVSVPQDIRWGRTYEGFSEDANQVIPLALAFARGLDKDPRVLHSFKHFVADGGTTWGSTTIAEWASSDNWQAATPFYKIDQGDARVDEATLREVHLRPYREAVEAGALNIMVSFSSWNGIKMHSHRHLLTEVLKGDYGFEGFLVSDWKAIDQIAPSYHDCVVQGINAGLDMVMVPYDFRRFIDTLTHAVQNGDIAQARIDDAVRRILRAKFALGLFEDPFGDEALLAEVGSPAHRAVAREAVRRSLVLLRNEGQTLPLAKDLPALLLAGNAADDVGLQCGGWTIAWQGGSRATGVLPGGTTVLEAVRQTVSPETLIHVDPAAQFAEGVTAPVGIAVIAEHPYAEGFGDNAAPALAADDLAMIDRLRARCDRLVVVLISGRPLIVTEALPKIDALVAAWLPGTEGAGITDVLFGDHPFTGRLAYSWLRSLDQLPLARLKSDPAGPLFRFGDGLV
ncbi:MAG: glycoside hydrolase family 3 C-terminal domain-containing protein [Anaerolineae bacterium]|nr:glycoside hydrolase family 3 C-terminal domain-containing protein [Anaerolineae bacterium]